MLIRRELVERGSYWLHRFSLNPILNSLSNFGRTIHIHDQGFRTLLRNGRTPLP